MKVPLHLSPVDAMLGVVDSGVVDGRRKAEKADADAVCCMSALNVASITQRLGWAGRNRNNYQPCQSEDKTAASLFQCNAHGE